MSTTPTPRPHPETVPTLPLERLLDDQSQCWERGERLPVEGYLRAYPGLADDTDALLDLIYHEVVLRTRRGEAPALEDYLRRFPHLADRLREQFDIHEALFAGATPRPSALPPRRPATHARSPARPPCRRWPATRCWRRWAAAAWASSSRPAKPA